ncbi:histidinol-phosphate transaminase [Pedobacter sp. MC2016-24]|uniref:pyridoxal phosphate-dependent aminotransferase n=1 Tax=Pedobacter sp. MC2016-24 TaxID=2780090 RepID=UPI00187E9BC1|nr:histidinol-phosphate transaminase [Pedobacter sp. MC2016-24]MBE9601659.1 histidinol-phosphate aminotransferase family protein [Pedobacter sp. MC2016-24]
MINFTSSELKIAKKLELLKAQAGSHSPSIITFKQKLPEIKIKVDACFLSNPYATDLFIEYFDKEILRNGKIRELLECYPSQNSVIAETLGAFLNINPLNIFIGNGAIEIIQAVIHNFTIRKIMINIPTFSSYYEYVKAGVEVVYNNLDKGNSYDLDVREYIDSVKLHRPDTIVLINPNNPNGGYTRIADVQMILEELCFVTNIIIDESFIHFAYENEAFQLVSLSHLVEKYPNLIVIKSMSKDFGVAGIRAGYGIMNAKYVEQLLSNGYLWNSNGLAEYFFRLYTDKDFALKYDRVRIRYIVETLEFIEQLKELPHIKVYPSMANFVLIELKDGMKSADFVSKLLISYGIYIRTCDDKIGLQGEFIRLASRSKAENEYIIASISACILEKPVSYLVNETVD